MISKIRAAYNEAFTPERYQEFLKNLDEPLNNSLDFRVAETPLFVPKELKKQLLEACDHIISVIQKPNFKEVTARAVPAHQNVPNEDAHSMFLALDFGVCKNEAGEIMPQLIELQGFPSLYAYQVACAESFKQTFDIPENFDYLFGKSKAEYLDFLTKTLLNGHEPHEVILLEIEPHKQKTRIDFVATEKFTGIPSVCISKLIKEGKNLFYVDSNGAKIQVKRIYNRVIFDELEQRTDLKLQFDLTQDVDVEWAGHPNWFFRISKYTMPFLKNKYVPETRFLNEVNPIPSDLSKYVLKPLFSFAGQGVIFDLTEADIEAIPEDQKQNFILQEKVNYEPVLKSPSGDVKCEIRMLYLWPENSPNPVPVINLCRLSKGKLIGVRYNAEFDWVGGSVAFLEKD